MTTALITLISVLVCCVIGAGAFFAAHYIVQLRHNRDILADELTRAQTHIDELESRVIMLEAERDSYNQHTHKTQPSGWDTMEMRS